MSTDVLGLPLSASGQNAIAYRFNAESRTVAVRCFVREPSDGPVRYQSLEQHLKSRPCEALAAAHWHQEGIRVDDTWWPIVVMPWVAGRPLNLVVEDIADDREAMLELVSRWRDVVMQLQASRIAHGDLQHGNVLVSDDLDVTLVDLDGVWVPSMPTGAPNENGHPNYQHPRRAAAHWGEHVDTFSAVLIELSLRAIAADPSLYCDFAGGENLVFTQTDLLRPGATPIWARLAVSDDADVRRAAAEVQSWCKESSPPVVKLEDVNGNTRVLDASVVTSGPAPLAVERTVSTGNWWEQDGSGLAVPSAADSTSHAPAAGEAVPSVAMAASSSQVAGRKARTSARARLGGNAPVAGLVAGLIAGLFGSLLQGALIQSPDTRIAAPVFVGVIAALLGGLLHGWQSFAAGANAAALRRFVIGGCAGAVAGIASLFLANLISEAMTDADTTSAPLVVVLVWAVVAAAVGLAVGALASARGAFAGYLGGAVGGAAGGFVFGAAAGDFDRGRLIIDGLEPVTVLSAMFVTAVVGLCVGLSLRTVRRGTLTIIEGRGKGVEVLVSRRTATIGSASTNTVVLTGDGQVHPVHARIHLDADGAHVEALAPLVVDGAPLSGSTQLADGSVLGIGGSFIRFEMS